MEQKDPLKDTYSVLSKASYDYYHNGVNKAQSELKEYSQTRNYIIDTKLSNRNAVVMKDANKVVISYRGTDLKNPSDILADTEILLGRDKLGVFLNDRFDTANSLYQKVKEEYPDSDITLTGHSLGSASAIFVGIKNNTKSVSFNEGTSPLDALFSQFGSKESDKKQIVYLTGKDLLSNFAGLQPYTIKYVENKKAPNLISHSLNYFLPKKERVTDIPVYLQPIVKQNYKPQKGITPDNYGIEYFNKLKKFKAGKK